MYSAIYYNLYAASTTTAQGRSCISAAALLFESVLANNVPFGSLNEVVTFIHNVKNDYYSMDNAVDYSHPHFRDFDWVRNIPLEEAFFKVVTSCGFSWVPTDSEMGIIWNIMAQLDQAVLNRLYYKNNLYEFCSNPRIMNQIMTVLSKLEAPFVDPNKVPDEVKDDMNLLFDLMYEYVYYHHQLIDRLEKMDALIRDVSILQDTDSAIISFDAWYNFVLNNTMGVPMKIKNYEFDPANEQLSHEVIVDDYDFFNDQIIEEKRFIRPVVMIPQDGLRHSIIAIMANIMGRFVNDFMYRYCCNSNSYLLPDADIPKGGFCMMLMKNESTKAPHSSNIMSKPLELLETLIYYKYIRQSAAKH